MSPITLLDLSILDAIAARHTPWLDAMLSRFTHLGDAGLCWIILALVLLAFRRTRPLGLGVALALLADLAVCNGCLKPLVGRVRPFQLREVALLIRAPSDASFPSGHTAAGFAAATALALRRSRLAIPAFALAALLGFSRLYLYVHFPTDVLGGMAVGSLCGVLGAWLAKILWKKKEC